MRLLVWAKRRRKESKSKEEGAEVRLTHDRPWGKSEMANCLKKHKTQSI